MNGEEKKANQREKKKKRRSRREHRHKTVVKGKISQQQHGENEANDTCAWRGRAHEHNADKGLRLGRKDLLRPSWEEKKKGKRGKVTREFSVSRYDGLEESRMLDGTGRKKRVA